MSGGLDKMTPRHLPSGGPRFLKQLLRLAGIRRAQSTDIMIRLTARRPVLHVVRQTIQSIFRHSPAPAPRSSAADVIVRC